MLETASEEMKTVTMDVTPEMAEFFLTKNDPVTGTKGGQIKNNRPLRAGFVNQLARKIRNGLWQHTHQGIAFYKDGHLADGQHRLSAIVMANRTVTVNVTFGLDREVGATIDIGKKRTSGDVLAMSGHADGNTLAAAVRAIALYQEGWTKGTHPVDPEEIQDMIRRHEEIVNFVQHGRVLAKEVGMTRGPATAAAYITDLPLDDPYYEGLIVGANLQSGDPRLILRRVMRNASRLHRNRPMPWQIAVFGKAYIAYEEGRKVSNLAYRSDEKMPVWGRFEVSDSRKRRR